LELGSFSSLVYCCEKKNCEYIYIVKNLEKFRNLE
jgi:hypothetical protein